MSEKWTEVISSKRGLFDLKLRELWHYRDLVWMFVRRDIVSIYKQTVLGPFWFFLSPFITVFMYTIVFSMIIGIDTEGIPAPIFYMAGTTLWNYFQQSFMSSSNTFVTNAGIFGKVYFPRLISPISSTISNLIKFGIQFLVLIILIIYYVVFDDFTLTIHPTLILLPILVFLMAGIAFGVGIITSALTSKYRDLQMFIGYGISLLMYATPVIYPLSKVPASLKSYVLLNPITPIIETFRYSIFGVGSFSWMALGYSGLFMMVVVFVGILLFNQVEKTFMDTV
jgi:lipopolysaccharide transport system permease protein